MATNCKNRDKWQARVRLKGIKPKAQSFRKKFNSVQWSLGIENRASLGADVKPRVTESTLTSDTIDKYVKQLKR